MRVDILHIAFKSVNKQVRNRSIDFRYSTKSPTVTETSWAAWLNLLHPHSMWLQLQGDLSYCKKILTRTMSLEILPAKTRIRQEKRQDTELNNFRRFQSASKHTQIICQLSTRVRKILLAQFQS